MIQPSAPGQPLKIVCPICGAARGERCHGGRRNAHLLRIAVAKRDDGFVLSTRMRETLARAGLAITRGAQVPPIAGITPLIIGDSMPWPTPGAPVLPIDPPMVDGVHPADAPSYANIVEAEALGLRLKDVMTCARLVSALTDARAAATALGLRLNASLHTTSDLPNALAHLPDGTVVQATACHGSKHTTSTHKQLCDDALVFVTRPATDEEVHGLGAVNHDVHCPLFRAPARPGA